MAGTGPRTTDLQVYVQRANHYAIAPPLTYKMAQQNITFPFVLSSRIVETLMLLGERLGCYKTSCECKDPLLSFYKQFGLKLEDKQNYLCKRFFH